MQPYRKKMHNTQSALKQHHQTKLKILSNKTRSYLLEIIVSFQPVISQNSLNTQVYRPKLYEIMQSNLFFMVASNLQRRWDEFLRQSKLNRAFAKVNAIERTVNFQIERTKYCSEIQKHSWIFSLTLTRSLCSKRKWVNTNNGHFKWEKAIFNDIITLQPGVYPTIRLATVIGMPEIFCVCVLFSMFSNDICSKEMLNFIKNSYIFGRKLWCVEKCSDFDFLAQKRRFWSDAFLRNMIFFQF